MSGKISRCNGGFGFRFSVEDSGYVVSDLGLRRCVAHGRGTEAQGATSLILVAEFIVGNTIAKSVKCIHSATKYLGSMNSNSIYFDPKVPM